MQRTSVTGNLPRTTGLQWVAVGLAICLAAVTSGNEQEVAGTSAGDIEFFEKRVRPILVARCYECHASTSQKLRGGLFVDSREGLMQGGDTGPAVAPGKPDQSLFVEAIGYNSQQIEMPPAGKLPPSEIAVLVEWVRRGIPFPAKSTRAPIRRGVDLDEGRKHWAFRPLHSAAGLPDVSPESSAWPRTRTDVYVVAKFADQELSHAPQASREVLLRRVKLDLVGLPPTREEIEAFLQDRSGDAYPRMVDGYLASPHYGERWGRHWLDLVRYCDVPESWREGDAKAWLYRDWVIEALNEDLPYDRFVRQQLAADLVPGSSPRENAALGLLGLSPTYWKELKLDHLVIKQVVAEEWEERIEAIGGTFLGLTLACARCHDHKYDPISMRDYYALAGVLASIKLSDRSLLPEPQSSEARHARARMKELQKQIDSLIGKKPISAENQAQADELRGQIERVRTSTPHLALPEAFGVEEASLQVLPDGPARTKLLFQPGEPQDVAVQIRGNPAHPGPIVPRGFPAVLSAGSGRRFEHGSGRLELAEAIVHDAAPLAARVLVNRIWQHHFGRGIVTTPSNFGTQGDPPSHPGLLDDLATRLIEHGWSLKWLHREILLSATYQQSADSSQSHAVDPDNVWLARMPLRRLQVEAWRDAILAATGELDDRLGGESQDLADGTNRRRTVYGTVKRRELTDILRLHDFPDPVAHVASREPTTTPLQELFVLNSPFLRQQSVALARRLLAAKGTDPAEQIQLVNSWVFGAEATAKEVADAREYLAAAIADGASQEEAWTELAQVLLGSSALQFAE